MQSSICLLLPCICLQKNVLDYHDSRDTRDTRSLNDT